MSIDPADIVATALMEEMRKVLMLPPVVQVTFWQGDIVVSEKPMFDYKSNEVLDAPPS